ncbi:MAG: SIMPL domain-containing protein [Vicinamibacterales bacterium]
MLNARRVSILSAFALAAALAVAAPAVAQTPPMPPAIVASGHASITRAPDQAWVSIAAEARAAEPAAAQTQSAEAMTAVRKVLAGAGFAEETIRTTEYSLRPNVEYENGRSRVRGYIARNEIEVRVDDLTKLGRVIDAAGGAGATSMSGLRFDLKNRADVEREALKMAVEDAMARARAMASGAGASLGPILQVVEQGARSAPVPMARMTMQMAEAAPAPPTPVSPGQLDITADVTVHVSIR